MTADLDSLAAQELAALEELAALKARLAKIRGKGVAGYYNDPVGFVNNCVKFRKDQGLAPYQVEIIGDLPRVKRIAVRGPRGLGKSCLASMVVLWFAVTRDAVGRDWKIATTAGSWAQLTDYLWPEISKWANNLNWTAIGREPFSPRAELMKSQLRLRHGLALAASPDTPQKIEGLHADSVLVLLDEAKIISPAIFDSIEGAFSGAGDGSELEAFALAISTPGEPAGRFSDIHTRKPGLEDWHTRHVTLDEAVAAKRLTRQWADQRRKLWGENSALYQNHVLGEFCADDEDAVIPLRWIEAAFERWRAWERDGCPDQDGMKVIGVDVARSGQDKSGAAIRHGNVITRIVTWSKEDTMATTGRVKGIMAGEPESTGVIDVIGIGAGVYDRLREMGLKVDPFNAGRRTHRKDKTSQFGFFNCLTGDARVLPVGEPLRIYRSRHEGPMFRIRMASGDEFTATPNHNVLTPGGWVPVKALNMGDVLCNADRGERMTPGQPDVRDMPPMLGEIYRAAHVRCDPERVGGAAVNFHGDRPVGEVEVVPVDSELFAVGPAGRQQCPDLEFIGLLHGQRGLAGDGTLAQPVRVPGGERVQPHGNFPCGGVAGRAGVVVGISEAGGHQPVSLGHPAHGNVPLAEDALHPSVGSPERPQEFLDGLAGHVAGGNGVLVEGMDDQRESIGPVAQRDIVLTENAPDDVLVNAEALAERVNGLADHIPCGEVIPVNDPAPRTQPGLNGVAWLDAVFGQDHVNGGPVGPEALAERCHRLAADIPLDEIVSIERTPPALGHEAPFVYTLETSTGAYRTASIVQRNCRSWAWWNLREMLEPPDSELALPPLDELAGDLTAMHYKYTSDGKIQVESKDEIRKRIGRSTDLGDMVMQACSPSAGSWADAYGVTGLCTNPKCGEMFRPDLPDGTMRTHCPHCRAKLEEPEEEAA